MEEKETVQEAKGEFKSCSEGKVCVLMISQMQVRGKDGVIENDTLFSGMMDSKSKKQE